MNMCKLKNLLPSNNFYLERSKLIGSKVSLEQTTIPTLDIIFDSVNPYAESNCMYRKRDETDFRLLYERKNFLTG
jgi:hypothetical protein